MNRFRTAVVAVLVSSSLGLPAAVASAQGRHDRDERYESKWERKEERKEDKRRRKEIQRDIREDRRELQAERRELNRNGYWDASRYYRNGAQYRPRRLSRNDRIYRGSDDRYYCHRDDGTTGLIIGGVAGGVLGNIIAPGDSKTIGTLIGAGAGALLGRAVDEGNIVCK